MPVSFEHIPANIRVPLFYVEVSARQASYFAQNQVSLLFGPMLPSGQAVPLQPVIVSQFDTAVGLFGAGSILADMVNVFRKNDSMGELWCIPHEEAAGGGSASATMTITVAGIRRRCGHHLCLHRRATHSGLRQDRRRSRPRLRAQSLMRSARSRSAW